MYPASTTTCEKQRTKFRPLYGFLSKTLLSLELSLANFKLNCMLLICAYNKLLFYVLALYCFRSHFSMYILKNAYLKKSARLIKSTEVLREVHSTLPVQIQGLIDFPKMLILIFKVINFTLK